jgi:hypothetical protein
MKRFSLPLILSIALLSFLLPSSNAQKKGKTRPITTPQLMAGLVKPQFVALKTALEKGPIEDADWKAVAMHAALLNESSYIMMADSRCPDKPWESGCKQMKSGSEVVLKHIAAKDAAAALEAFAGIQAACKTCHTEHKYKKKK